ncbi:unnamed protein product [Closterium sp. NIES-53]
MRPLQIAQALYDGVVARYSSRATATLGRLLLPYLFPELSAFATVEDLVSHLRASDARYRAAAPAEFLDRNQPPMFITLYFIVTRSVEVVAAVGVVAGVGALVEAVEAAVGVAVVAAVAVVAVGPEVIVEDLEVASGSSSSVEARPHHPLP